MEQLKRAISVLILSLAAVFAVRAQKFSVESFRLLANDVTAFINPVEDLNGDRCALVKIEASPDFVFSTPLGIVKRIDKTGEIWLYLPQRSKMITLKHPVWGVLRDYRFPSKLVSQQTYEMRIATPGRPGTKTAQVAAPVTVRDTLLIVRTDTLMIAPPKVSVPFSTHALATFGYGGSSDAAGGIMLAAMKRIGAFVHISTDFRSIGKTGRNCDRDGAIDGISPYYSGKVKRSLTVVTGGLAERLSDRLCLFQGAGYGTMTTAWELAASEGGGYVKNSYYSHRGLSFEAGAIMSFGRASVSASVSSVRGKLWFGNVGIGIRLGGGRNKTGIR